jgi:hypothetical protein
MQIAQQKLNLLDSNSEQFKTLDAMLKGSELYPQTQQAVINQISDCNDIVALEFLSSQYTEWFIKSFLTTRAKNISGSSTPQGKNFNRLYVTFF